MENALRIGLSRQAALAHQLDVIANNLANLNTTGYRAEKVQFSEFMMPVAEADTFTGDDQTLSYVADGTLLYDGTPGSIRVTGNPLDVAIDGEGWFVVDTPDGERFTRNGSFTLNAAGELVAANGQPVLGDGGPLTFAAGETGITITADGSVSSSAGAKGRLRLVGFADTGALQREGDMLFSGENAEPVAAPRVRQGAIEQSNVRAVTEIADMVAVTRAYTNLAKFMTDSDDLRRTAIEQLGTLKN